MWMCNVIKIEIFLRVSTCKLLIYFKNKIISTFKKKKKSIIYRLFGCLAQRFIRIWAHADVIYKRSSLYKFHKKQENTIFSFIDYVGVQFSNQFKKINEYKKKINFCRYGIIKK